jgi:hypothetical protein
MGHNCRPPPPAQLLLLHLPFPALRGFSSAFPSPTPSPFYAIPVAAARPASNNFCTFNLFATDFGVEFEKKQRTKSIICILSLLIR